VVITVLAVFRNEDGNRERVAMMSPGNVVSISQFKLSGLQGDCAAPLPVICVGYDTGLLRLRESLIQQAGYPVNSVLVGDAVTAAKAPHSPCVWVFCHTVWIYDTVHLASTLRRHCPEDKLMLLTRLHEAGSEAVLFHSVVPQQAGVESFLKAVATLSRAHLEGRAIVPEQILRNCM
jgi:hypothetical protein